MARIKTIEQVLKAADQGKALWVMKWERWSAAAYLSAMQCHTLAFLIKSGIYTKKQPPVGQ
jgi:hypothetical protein